MHAALLCLTLLAFEDPPRDVIEFFQAAAAALGEAHADGNAAAFLDHFDTSMPGYEAFRQNIEAMVGAGEVNAAIDFVNQSGNEKKRILDLDVVLQCEGERPKRSVIQCTIEKKGKKWKITSLAPLDFFKRE